MYAEGGYVVPEVRDEPHLSLEEETLLRKAAAARYLPATNAVVRNEAPISTPSLSFHDPSKSSLLTRSALAITSSAP